MGSEEILRVLKEGANFEIEHKVAGGFGAIDKFDECGKMSQQEYSKHYEQKRMLLESLPWNVVKNPRNPMENEYPKENGTYLTMLDCDEHKVLLNTFKNGRWLFYHETHIKWWMPNPFEN